MGRWLYVDFAGRYLYLCFLFSNAWICLCNPTVNVSAVPSDVRREVTKWKDAAEWALGISTPVGGTSLGTLQHLSSFSCGTGSHSADQTSVTPSTTQAGAMMSTYHFNVRERKLCILLPLFLPLLPRYCKCKIHVNILKYFGLIFFLSCSELFRSCYLFFLYLFGATARRENFDVWTFTALYKNIMNHCIYFCFLEYKCLTQHISYQNILLHVCLKPTVPLIGIIAPILKVDRVFVTSWF